MGPTLWEMVENTTPHPEASAYGNTQVNDASPRCLRQKHSFTDKVSVRSADKHNPILSILGWLHSVIYPWEMLNQASSPASPPMLRRLRPLVCAQNVTLGANRESKAHLKPSTSILWLVMPLPSRKSCRGTPFHPHFPLQQCPYMAAPEHQPERLGEMLLSWEKLGH